MTLAKKAPISSETPVWLPLGRGGRKTPLQGYARLIRASLAVFMIGGAA